MKQYRAIVMFMDFTFVCNGFDDKLVAATWCKSYDKVGLKAVFAWYVIDGNRMEVTDLSE